MSWWNDPFGGFGRRGSVFEDRYYDPTAISRVNPPEKLADYALFRIRYGLAADCAQDRSVGTPSTTNTHNILINLANSNVLSTEVLECALGIMARKPDPNYDCVTALVTALHDKAARAGTPIDSAQISNMTSLPTLIHAAKGLVRPGYHVQSHGAKHPPVPAAPRKDRDEYGGGRYNDRSRYASATSGYGYASGRSGYGDW